MELPHSAFTSLFREFLSQRWIEERGLGSLQAARSSLARWYHKNNDTASAYQVACEAEDWESAVAVIGPIARAFANRGEAGFLRELLGRIPVDRIRESRPIWESWVRGARLHGRARRARRGARTSFGGSTVD